MLPNGKIRSSNSFVLYFSTHASDMTLVCSNDYVLARKYFSVQSPLEKKLCFHEHMKSTQSIPESRQQGLGSKSSPKCKERYSDIAQQYGRWYISILKHSMTAYTIRKQNFCLRKHLSCTYIYTCTHTDTLMETTNTHAYTYGISRQKTADIQFV